MSYILDALKKSDKERQRKRRVPDLDTVPLESVPQRKKKVSWPISLAAIVLVNAIFILYFVKLQNQPGPETKDIVSNSDQTQQETVQAGPQAAAPQTTPAPVPAGNTPLQTEPAAAEDTGTMALLTEHDTASRQDPGPAPPLAQGERSGSKMQEDTDTAVSRENGADGDVANMAHDVTPEASPVSREAVQSEPAAIEEESAGAHMAEGDTTSGPEPAAAPLSPGENAAGRQLPEEDAQAAESREVGSEVESIGPQEAVADASESESPVMAAEPEEYAEIPEQDQAGHPQLAETADSGPSEPQAGLMQKAVHINQLPATVRNQLPDIHIGAHLFYKDKPASRFASINGKILREGQRFDQDLKVAEITTDGVIFSYQKYLFYMPVF